MINLIYLCFYSSYEEKRYIYEVLTNEVEIINYCQESVKPNISNQINPTIPNNFENTDLNIFIKNQINIFLRNKNNEEKYFKVIEIIDKYFKN